MGDGDSASELHADLSSTSSSSVSVHFGEELESSSRLMLKARLLALEAPKEEGAITFGMLDTLSEVSR